MVEMEKPENVSMAIFFLGCLYVAGYSQWYRFENPKLTETELAINLWWMGPFVIVNMVVCSVLYAILKRFCE